jgi:hypothetical protein
MNLLSRGSKWPSSMQLFYTTWPLSHCAHLNNWDEGHVLVQNVSDHRQNNTVSKLNSIITWPSTYTLHKNLIEHWPTEITDQRKRRWGASNITVRDSQRPSIWYGPLAEKTNQRHCLTSHTLTFTADTLQASLSAALTVRRPRGEGFVLLFTGNH